MHLQLTRPTIIVGLIVLIIAVSVSYAGYFHDQSIKGVYNDLTPRIYHDRNQIANQNATISSLQTNVANQNAQISQLQNTVNSQNNQISQLQAASVDGWFTFTGTQCYYTCSVNGAVSNYGTQDAKNIVATLTWKNNGAFVQTNTLTIGSLAGRSLQLFPLGTSSQYFTLNAPANQLSWSFTWTS